MCDEAGEAAHFRLCQREVGRRDRADHGDHEQQQIGDHHTPKPRGGGVDDRNRPGDEHGGVLVHAEQHAGDLDRRQRDRGHDHHVEEDAQVERPEAAQERGDPAGIAQLVEADVGERARAPPQLRVEEHRAHAGDQERPPQPVLAHAAGAHHVGDQVGRVGGERGRHHGGAEQPPRRFPPREEELPGPLTRAASEEKTHGQDHAAVKGDHEPVESGKLHG